MIRRSSRGFAGAVLAIALLAAAVVPPDDRQLLDAVKRGDAAAVRALLKEGADANAAQGDGLTALHIAAQEGQIEIVKVLLGAGASVEAKSRIGAYTPLHLAAGTGDAAVVTALLDAGAAVNATTSNTGVTPLHLAAKALNGEAAVRVLLEGGASVNAVDKAAGETPLMYAAAAGRTASVRELLKHGADPKAATEVVDVLRSMYLDRIAQQRLRQAGQEIRRVAGETGRALTPQEEQKAIAAQREFVRNDAEVQKALADFTPDKVGSKGPSWNTPSGYQSDVEIMRRPQREHLVGKQGGMTALHLAARDGRIETAAALLDGGADINQRAGDGSTALVVALLNGQWDLALDLINRGADPSIATDTDRISPVFAVLQTQWAFKFGDHTQPRTHEVQKSQYLDVLNALLAKGGNPNIPLKTHLWHSEYFEGKLGLDITGATPFWRAAIAQDVEAMKALAKAGADPNIPTTLPEPGLRYGRQNDGRLQEDSGLPILPEGHPNMFPIHAAAGGGYLGLGAFMMNNVPNNFLPAVKYLVEEHGADVNLPDGWGYTPLHYAAVRGDNPLIEYLVSKGADVKKVSRLGQSPVDMARGGRAGYFDRTLWPQTVELLQRLGSPFLCMHTHFRGTGDWCEGAGVPRFDETPLPKKDGDTPNPDIRPRRER